MIKGRFEEMILGLLGQGSLNEGDILRQYYIETGLAEFKESPIWGNGFYYSAYLFGHYSHNNYIELLMNNGIIGFIAYYSIYIKLLIDAFKMKTTFHKSYVLIVLVVFVFLALDLGTVSYFDRYTLLILAVCSRIFVTNEYKNRLTVE
jgi:O-antigen ligase